jgi:hypothetical protein
MCQAIDTPIGGDYIMTVSEEECKWIDRKNHKENQVTKYEVLISDVRVFKITVQASNLEAANELADAALEAGYEEHGELVEVRDPSVDDVQEPSVTATESFRNNPSPRREWRDDWKDYTDDLAIPEDWEDVSWHNNELPSFIVNGYHIWMNSPRAEERKENYTSNGWNPDDYEDWRFLVNLYNEEDGEIIYPEDGSDPVELLTLDFDEVVAFVSKPRS